MTQHDLISMETRMAYQEKLLQELSGVVFAQQREIDHLRDLGRILSERLQGLSEGFGQNPCNEKPPHY